MIKFIVTEKNNNGKYLIQEFRKKIVLEACRVEDKQKSTEEELNAVLKIICYYFNGIPFITNRGIGTKEDALYAAFYFITASPLVKKWAEKSKEPFSISLEIDHLNQTTEIKCVPNTDFFRVIYR